VDSRQDRIGFVSELPDDDDFSRLSGLFAAHWESSSDPKVWGQGPDGVPAGEAIAWAREHATRVLVRLGDSDALYSAGEQELEGEDDDEIRTWPADGIVIRPRPTGSPRDGSVQEIPWKFVGTLAAGVELDELQLARLRTALENDERVSATSVGRDDGSMIVCCQVVGAARTRPSRSRIPQLARPSRT
jgi:hypothetical protein